MEIQKTGLGRNDFECFVAAETGFLYFRFQMLFDGIRPVFRSGQRLAAFDDQSNFSLDSRTIF